MNNGKPVRLRVDAANPGQFLACCGLLELAGRLWGDAEGWFDAESFSIDGGGAFPDVIRFLVDEIPTEVLRIDNGPEIKPLIAPLRFAKVGSSCSLNLDAWMTIRSEKGLAVAIANRPWNFWSGQQTSLRIWTALRFALAEQLPTLDALSPEDLLFHRVLLSGRFGFDPGAAWNALDVGFSPNEQGMEVASSPLVEMLAAIGLQRFRPRRTGNGDTFLYATWGRRLPPSVAAAASVAEIPGTLTCCYLGRVVSRGSYAALGYSTPLQGESHV